MKPLALLALILLAACGLVDTATSRTLSPAALLGCFPASAYPRSLTTETRPHLSHPTFIIQNYHLLHRGRSGFSRWSEDISPLVNTTSPPWPS